MNVLPKNFLISPRKRLIRGSCIIFGLGCILLGFWNRINLGEQKTLWVIDNSLSMTVMDIHTKTGITQSRLDLAKQIVKHISSQKNEEQAIMTAHNGAKLELPLTNDSTILREVIEGITPISRGGGSSIVTPLEIIRLIYGELPNLNIIWITDGEFFDSGSTLSGFLVPPTITFIGVGTLAGGPILEGYDSSGFPRYKQSQGEQINSVRDDKKLKQTAQLLNASIKTKDTNSFEDLEYLTRENTSIKSYNGFFIIGFLLTLIGLIFPRYQYLSLKKTGK